MRARLKFLQMSIMTETIIREPLQASVLCGALQVSQIVICTILKTNKFPAEKVKQNHKNT